MVDSAMLQCRRDLLWQRMLLSQAVGEEEGRRKRRSERQGDADDLVRLLHDHRIVMVYFLKNTHDRQLTARPQEQDTAVFYQASIISKTKYK